LIITLVSLSPNVRESNHRIICHRHLIDCLRLGRSALISDTGAFELLVVQILVIVALVEVDSSTEVDSH